MSDLYPWGGKYKTGHLESPIAVVTLNTDFDFPEDKVAIWGKMKTENLGIEKVIANVISNPYIRFVIICGEEIRGHRSGNTLKALIENGIDEKGRIIDAPGAVPYIENIENDAVERFRKQVTMIDKIDVTKKESILEVINSKLKKNPDKFGEPFIAIKVKKEEKSKLEADIALHVSLKLTPWGEISSAEKDSTISD
ncbi:MAG: tetrahydromethanopterin S-methyltransferase subunit A [Thermoplasmatota archaeon]